MASHPIAGAAHLPHLYFMTDSVRTPDPTQVAERLPAERQRFCDTMAQTDTLCKDLAIGQDRS